MVWLGLLVSACTHSRAPLAQACSPGMSCFGKVVLLPNGEVAAAAAAAAATGAAVGKATSADKVKTADKATTKAEPKVQLKKKVTCEIRGGSVPKKNNKLRCTYHCPGDPPGVTQEVLLDIKICPQFWDFYR